MIYEVDLSLEDVRAVANGEPYDTWGEAQVWDGKIGAEYNLCFDEDNCSAIYLMEEGEDGCWSTDVSTFEHYEIDPDDPEWKENLIKAMTEFVDSKSHMNELRTLCKKLKENYSIPYLVGCVYDLFQDYLISEEQEEELYNLVDPEELYNSPSEYWEDIMQGGNPLMECFK